MGHRSFTDAQGTEWQAWDVMPQLANRRAVDRRVASVAVAVDRRRQQERRVVDRHRPSLTDGLNSGWLCFEASHEKRRLAPIPSDWLRCAVDALREYLASARPAPRLSLATIATHFGLPDRSHR